MKTHIIHSILAVFAVTCLGFSERAEAQLPSPAPDGAYPNFNTAEGDGALFSVTTGAQNTAIGASSLTGDKTGSYNTATGTGALNGNDSGNENTAVGALAMYQNVAGTDNTAVGRKALMNNVSHAFNTATGFEALQNADADDNTATGALSLNSDTTGYYNTAQGVSALYSNATGYYNTANGVSALYFNVAGHDNTADGLQALLHNKGSTNVGIGSNAGANLTTGSNNIEIGANVTGNAGEANTIRVGKQGTQKSTFIAGIAGTAVSGSTVVVSSAGKLGVASSSARFKEAIKPMDKASEAILALKPVTFRYKAEVDPDGGPQFGLVAEEVEKVDRELVVHDEAGKPFTVRYEAVNAMLLNEFLKAHHQLNEQQQEIARLRAELTKQKVSLETVNAKLKASKAAPKLTVNNE